MNILEEIQKECDRARELKAVYDKIPSGKFGSIMIDVAIERSEKAIAQNDVVGIIIALKQLKSLE